MSPRTPIKKFKDYVAEGGFSFACKRAFSYFLFLLNKPIHFKPRYEITKGFVHIAFDGTALRIFYKRRDVSHWPGLSCSVCVLGSWTDSSKAEGRVVAKSADSLKIKIWFKELPLSQFWTLSIKGDSQIDWSIDADCEENLFIDAWCVTSFVCVAKSLNQAVAQEYKAGLARVFSGRISFDDKDKVLSACLENLCPEKSFENTLGSKKVLLANLPWQRDGKWGVRAGSRWPHIKGSNEDGYLPYPFFLAYATSLLRSKGVEATLIDAIAERLPEDTFLEMLKKESLDYLVVETSIPSFADDLALIKKIAARGISVILCGPQSEIYQPEFLQEHSFISFVLFGEYEFSLWELIVALQSDKDLSSVKGLIYRKAGEVVKNPLREPEDINLLPWPYRDTLPMEAYQDAPGEMRSPGVQMMASRGCPFQCGFCLWPQVMYQGHHYRFRLVDDVVNEMEYLVKEKGFKSVYFDDDTFNIGSDRMLEFCRAIKKKGLETTPWAIMARPDLMSEQVLRAMKDAGLWAVKYGVESADQELVNRINKAMDLKKTEQMIRLTQKFGIRTHLTFTFGLLGETKQTIEKTIRWALELDPFSVQFSITTPFPGTSYHQILEKDGMLVSKNLSDYDGHAKSVIKLPTLSPQDLECAKERAYQMWGEHVRKRGSASKANKFFRCWKEQGFSCAVLKSLKHF